MTSRSISVRMPEAGQQVRVSQAWHMASCKLQMAKDKGSGIMRIGKFPWGSPEGVPEGTLGIRPSISKPHSRLEMTELEVPGIVKH